MKTKKKPQTYILPDGVQNHYTVALQSANKLFGLPKTALAFEVPVFKWDYPHQHVPAIDKSYEFDAATLLPVLWSLRDNKKLWVHGHTGTGKSTLIQQVCARLNWSMLRVNFDSEITRMDLVGRDVLKSDGKNTISQFVDGILPQALSGPYVLLCDEMDFIRPDVAYVLQRALEDEGMLITEDGGRLIVPHVHSRIVATANTQGQGDEHGIYQGARAQSLAFLDRFTCWLSCGYLNADQETRILKAKIPAISADNLSIVLDYVREHRAAFLSSKIMQPISPRGLLALAEGLTLLTPTMGDAALKAVAQCVLLDKANPSDSSVMKGILDRIEPPSKKNLTADQAEAQRQQILSQLRTAL